MQDSINKFRIKEMKMRNLIGLALVIFVFASCKKTTEETIVYDNVIYEINDVEVYASNAQKTKQKTPEQYISIMYNDIYNQSISTTFLQDLSQFNVLNKVAKETQPQGKALTGLAAAYSLGGEFLMDRLTNGVMDNPFANAAKHIGSDFLFRQAARFLSKRTIDNAVNYFRPKAS